MLEDTLDNVETPTYHTATLPGVIVHGGAWNIPDHLAAESKAGVKLAARAAYCVLLDGGSAVDAVEAAVRQLEDDPAFDAGTGSCLNNRGEVEMDAVIMDGSFLNAGGVACVQNIAHPISLARLVMEKTSHTLLVGAGANEFAAEMNVPTVHPDCLVTDEAKQDYIKYCSFKEAVGEFWNNNLVTASKENVTSKPSRNEASTNWNDGNGEDIALKVVDLNENLIAADISGAKDEKYCEETVMRNGENCHDTVGAAAVDKFGNVAFATSTGGIPCKRPGRVGDSPIIGAGGYADNAVGAVSCTGHGESISKVCLAHRTITNLRCGSSANTAAQEAVEYMSKRVQGLGGVIVISKSGEMGWSFTSSRMAWAAVNGSTAVHGLEPGEVETWTL